MTLKGVALYSVLCIAFWVLGVCSPFRWSSLFLKADYHHVYIHFFYAGLLILGLLARIPALKGIIRSAIVGLAVGLVSSVIAILSVDLSRVGVDVLVDRVPREGGVPALIATWAMYSVILGAPFWGAMLAVMCDVLARRLRFKPLN